MFKFSSILSYQYELTNDIDRDHLKIDEHEHIDHENEHTFEIEDLKKLILKTSQDLAEADKQRRDEFKVSCAILLTDKIGRMKWSHLSLQ